MYFFDSFGLQKNDLFNEFKNSSKLIFEVKSKKNPDSNVSQAKISKNIIIKREKE